MASKLCDKRLSVFRAKKKIRDSMYASRDFERVEIDVFRLLDLQGSMDREVGGRCEQCKGLLALKDETDSKGQVQTEVRCLECGL